MNILVFSSAMRDSDFSKYIEEARVKPNPSNQNFYSKLIKTLLINNNVSVISRRPFTKGMFRKNILEEDFFSDKNLKFYYTKVQTDVFYKLMREQNIIYDTAVKAIEDFVSNDFIIVVDSLNLMLINVALKISKKYNAKIVGMLTDNPLNLSSGSTIIYRHAMRLVSRFDGYLSLTQNLADLYNCNIPSYIFDGLVSEETEGKKDPISNYFYFGGSLYERYGVKDLIDAFHESNTKSKLVIAGSGSLEKYIEEMCRKDYRILYLSQLSKEKNFAYMKNSLANINPRPLNKKLDSESVPSKLLEYLSIGIPTISTKFPRFYGTFKDDVIWIEENGKDAIIKTIEQFDLSKIEEYNKKALTARRKVFEFYGLDVQAESINYFLASVNSSRSK